MSHTQSALSLLITLLPIVVIALVAVYMRKQGYSRRGSANVIVRCKAGHLFTTIWIPGVSLKAVRLGMIRFQHCPIGNHWTLVDLVNPEDLTESERKFADSHPDSNIP